LYGTIYVLYVFCQVLAVVLSDLVELMEGLVLLRLISQGEEDIRQGKTITQKRVVKDMKNMLAQHGR
jgi:hypothetical protein